MIPIQIEKDIHDNFNPIIFKTPKLNDIFHSIFHSIDREILGLLSISIFFSSWNT